MQDPNMSAGSIAQCPYCGHKDPQHRNKVGEAAVMVCTDCGRLWMASVIGSVYRGEIGHGYVQLIWENRGMRVDAEGRLRVERLPSGIEEGADE